MSFGGMPSCLDEDLPNQTPDAGASTPRTSPTQQQPPSFFPVSHSLSKAILLALSCLSVACWSVAGNAARIVLLEVLFVNKDFFRDYHMFAPNCTGCFIMGVISAVLSPSDQDRFAPLVFRGLLIGFCGSLTSLSTWVLDIVNRPTAGAALTELMCGMSMPFVFFVFGRDTMRGLNHLRSRYIRPAHANPPNVHCGHSRSNGEPVAESGIPEIVDELHSHGGQTTGLHIWVTNVVFVGLSVAGAIAIPIGLERAVQSGRIQRYHLPASKLYEAVIAPAGAVPRYLLAVMLNNRVSFRNFPVGTFAANVISVFIAVFLDAFGNRWEGGGERNWMLVALTGICGALSTVSTWVREILLFTGSGGAGGRLAFAYLYGACTVVTCVAIAIIGRRGNYYRS